MPSYQNSNQLALEVLNRIGTRDREQMRYAAEDTARTHAAAGQAWGKAIGELPDTYRKAKKYQYDTEESQQRIDAARSKSRIEAEENAYLDTPNKDGVTPRQMQRDANLAKLQADAEEQQYLNTPDASGKTPLQQRREIELAQAGLKNKLTQAQIAQMHADAGEKLASAKGGGKPTPGQQAVDKQFAESYEKNVASGGAAETEKSIRQLKEVSNKLASKKKPDGAYSGPVAGITPDWIRAYTNPDAIAARDAVREVVQKNMKLLLGNNFTEAEGQRVINSAYNEKLSDKENKKRVDALIGQIAEKARAQEKANKYYEDHGTLQGFKGSESFKSVDQIIADIEKVDGGDQNQGGDGTAIAAPQGSAALPKQVRQNGVTYTLNPETGKYE